MRITAEHVIHFIEGVAARIKEHRDELVALDSPIGDADHGINMDRGFSMVLEKLPRDELVKQVTTYVAAYVRAENISLNQR